MAYAASDGWETPRFLSDGLDGEASEDDLLTVPEGVTVEGRRRGRLGSLSVVAAVVGSVLLLTLLASGATRRPPSSNGVASARGPGAAIALQEAPPVSPTPATPAQGGGCGPAIVQSPPAAAQAAYAMVGKGFCDFDQTQSHICKTGGWEIDPCTLDACFRKCASNTCCKSFAWNPAQCHCALVNERCLTSGLQVDAEWKQQSTSYNIDRASITASPTTTQSPQRASFGFTMGNWKVDQKESTYGLGAAGPAQASALGATSQGPCGAALAASPPSVVASVAPLPVTTLTQVLTTTAVGAPPSAAAPTTASAGGACTDAQNVGAFAKVEHKEFTATMNSCATGCVGGSYCTAACFKRTQGYTLDCATCFGDLAQCTRDSCFWKCSFTPHSRNCVDCSESKCMPGYRRCAGVAYVPGGGGGHVPQAEVERLG